MSSHSWTRLAPALVVAVSLAALGTALASQYWGGLLPCLLCIWQRWAYGAALAAGLAGLALAGRPALRRACLLLAALAFLAGSGIAVFHVGVEQGWWQGSSECQGAGFTPGMSAADIKQSILTAPTVACDAVPWSLFGLSIAGFNALFSLLFAAVTLWFALRRGRPA